MKFRLITAAAVSAALVVTVTAAHAATPVLDGKKLKTLSLTATAAVQDHDVESLVQLAKDPLASPDLAQCAAPSCADLTFVYKPAKGVKADTGFSLSWTTPADDMDLYVAEVVKGERSTVASCGGATGTSEKVVVPYGTLVSGHTYALVAYFYRSTGDTVKAQVSFPSTVAVKTTVPAGADKFGPVDCNL